MDALQLSKSHKVATVIGPTGLIGSYLLRHLEKDDAYAEVYAVSRSAPALDKGSRIKWIPFPDGLRLSSKQAESDLEKIRMVLPEGNDFFSCLGTTRAKAGSAEAFYSIDFQLNFLFAKAAVASGYGQYFLVSSAGADARSSFLYSRVKGELELAVKSLPFWSTQIFRPSLLLGTRNEMRWGEKTAETMLKMAGSIFGKTIQKYRPIEAEAVAICMTKAAREMRGGIKIHSNIEMSATSKNLDILSS